MSDLAIVALFCGGGGPLLVGEAGREAAGEGAWGRGGELPALRRNNMAGGGGARRYWSVAWAKKSVDERHRQRQWPPL